MNAMKHASISANRAPQPALLLTLAVIATSLAAPWRANGIINGEPDAGGHPNVGAVVINDPVGGPIVRCSGTLVHERVFLTAGHCPFFFLGDIAAGLYSIDDVYVTFDTDNALDASTWLPISDMFPDPDFSLPPIKMNNWQDHGVLILQDPVVGIVPATLPTAGLLDELQRSKQLQTGRKATQFTVVGYGNGLEFPPPQEVERDGMRRTAQTEYVGLFQSFLKLQQNPAAGEGGISSGDSGGPVFWTDPAGDQILVAITSLTPGYSFGPLAFSVRIDTPAAHEFIGDVIAAVEGP